MNIFKRSLLLSAFLLSSLIFSTSSAFSANYFANEQEIDTVVTPGRVQSEGKVEVVEFFWYGCPHCARFEPTLEDWVQKLPEDVAFIRLPASWNDGMVMQQRLYFTLAKLDRLDLHPFVFEAIHKQHKSLNTPASIEKWAATQKIKASVWRNAFNSKQVSDQVKGAQNAFERFELGQVPMIVVNGKYVIAFTPNVLGHANELIQKELKTQSSNTQ